ncbi:MAG: ERCC4 domain-containing protein [Thermoprotei archaeon]|jgi:ERCC4-type nuclease
MAEDGHKVIVDTREPQEIVELLREAGLGYEQKQLSVGDYIIDSETAVERKTATDFVRSLFDGRLLDQCSRLSSAYSNAILIVEGNFADEVIWRKNPKAYWGALVALYVEKKVAPFFTPNLEQTANLLSVLARRRWEKKEARLQIRQRPRLLSLREKQIYVVQGLPGVGSELAERLLKHFGSVRSVMKASEAELMAVDGIGKAKASAISSLLDASFNGWSSEQRKLIEV